MNAPTTTNYNFLDDGINPFLTTQVYTTSPPTSSPNITITQPPSSATQQTPPPQTTNQTTFSPSITSSAQQPTPTTQTTTSSTQTTPTTSSPSTQTSFSPPAPHSPQMTTRAQHGIFKPRKLFNLHTSTHQSISPLPTNPIDALNDHNWKMAMKDEYDALIENKTWELVPRPSNANVIRSLWIFRHKKKSDGSFERYKARLVDVKNGFLHGNLDETVYMHQPPGFRNPRYPEHVCLLKKSLYGLKQAPRAWYQRFTDYVAKLGFSHSISDHSLFIYHHGNDTAYILLYVDDIILTASSDALRDSIMSQLSSEFAMKDLGPLSYFLGISVTKHTSGLFLSQKKYAEEIIERAGMSSCKSSPTPVDTKAKLSGSSGNPYHDPTEYRSLADALQYLTFTRPDISYAVQQVCLFMHDPKTQHMSALKHIIRYIHGTLDFGLHLYPSSISKLVSYTDADWAGCPDTRIHLWLLCLSWGQFDFMVCQTPTHSFSV
ncbi:unnamed protein product [Trifolium pratense]|uniref:Uncharacterized protein n=1 Tax=Trifolium pratense TaxID=57577 RepID=A0ACB0LTV6_TRIPR|nr:unnamed protein product [Trifolium pratense]